MHVYSEINPAVINKVYSVINRFSFVCPTKKSAFVFKVSDFPNGQKYIVPK